jgi:hypothetical protein
MSDPITDPKKLFAQTHGPAKCRGRTCIIHSPTEHHMREWPVLLRDSGLIERTCKHGVSHPDPDILPWLEILGMEGMGVHGCDGCCDPDEITEVLPKDWQLDLDNDSAAPHNID